MPPDSSGLVTTSGEAQTDRIQFETLISDIPARLIAAASEVEPAIEAALDLKEMKPADKAAADKAAAEAEVKKALWK